MAKNKIAVYTAITGKYEKLKEPRFVSKKCDYICFTDDKSMKSNIWEIRKIKNPSDHLIKTARRYKILPHLYLPDYEYSIWVDGSMLIIGDLNKLLKKELDNEKMAFFKHPTRDCLYDEARVCSRKKDNPKIISKQIERYKLAGYKKNQGLIASGVIMRKHNEAEVKKLMKAWWNEVASFSIRDQISFNYVAWKNKASYKIIQKNIFHNEYFTRTVTGRKRKKN
ncbi:glycosyltransferase [Clostridium aceticum]|uniref:Glycosyltransferase n=1 Tax=Clostridium aceticum TaxID=84022 RepID=A0A0G3WBD4_9CLOT|nr:glycosyltransferase domain-containing protein [Clostridium aceticum]AKL95227.1 glycosyltransferase [Clostridium aceticum]